MEAPIIKITYGPVIALLIAKLAEYAESLAKMAKDQIATIDTIDTIKTFAKARHERARKAAAARGRKDFPSLPIECSWAFEERFRRGELTYSAS